MIVGKGVKEIHKYPLPPTCTYSREGTFTVATAEYIGVN
jgi:hypothetical protein